jgi:hypothetical protein
LKALRVRAEGTGTKLISYDQTIIDGRIELVAVDDGAWRISDARLPENDGRRVLGYLERTGPETTGPQYELVWLRFHPGRTERYTCMAAALTAVSERMHRQLGAAA